ncbi:MAG TPA: hypothetical protein VJR47_16645 [Stellaceae bacterium]|nr:hypothetical protein [Stellaceae bacterium]
MGRLGSLLVLSLLAVASVAFAQAPAVSEAPANSPEAVTRTLVVGDHDKIQARVDAIDYASRTVALKTDSGSITLQVGPQAKNFNQVKVGDKVTADFYSAAAVYVRRVGDPPSVDERTAVEYAAPGAQPGGIIVNTKEITARVDAIDPKTRMLILMGPAGNRVSIKVDDAVENFNRIKTGDQVVVRYAEALALSVDKN